MPADQGKQQLRDKLQRRKVVQWTLLWIVLVTISLG